MPWNSCENHLKLLLIQIQYQNQVVNVISFSTENYITKQDVVNMRR